MPNCQDTPLPLLSPAEEAFARTVSELVHCNPFTARRIELERQALGAEFVEKDAEWNDRAVEGTYRFLGRVWRLVVDHRDRIPDEPVLGHPPVLGKPGKPDLEPVSDAVRVLRRSTHRTIQRVTQDVDRLHLNTAVSALMEHTHAAAGFAADLGVALGPDKASGRALREALEALVLLVAPFAPHIAEELWQRLGNPTSVFRERWPVHDPELAASATITLVVQVNGKVRARLDAPAGLSETEAKGRALGDPRVQAAVGERAVRKVVVVPDKLVNLVVG